MTAPAPQADQDDIQAAVEAGLFDADAAEKFRALIERRRATPLADEESFRLLTGFNDIFVAIALSMVLFALAWLVSVIWYKAMRYDELEVRSAHH